MRTFSIGILFLFLCLNLQATTGDSQSVTFDGSQNVADVNLKGEVTHTEYRTEEYQSTCSREVFDGYYRVCRNVPSRVCSTRPRSCRRVCTGNRPGQPGNRTCHNVCTGGGTTCRTVYRQRCEQRSRYRTEHYPCTRTRQVPYTVFDFYTDANTNIKFGSVPAGIQPNEIFTIKLAGEKVSLSVKGSDQLIIIQTSRTQTTNMNGSTKFIDTNYKIDFESAAVLEAFEKGILSSELTHDGLTFKTAPLSKKYPHTIKLHVEKKRFLIRNKVYLDKKFDMENILSDETADTNVFNVNFADIDPDIKIKKGKFKYSISIVMKFNADDVLNLDQLPNLRMNLEKEVKLKKR